MADQQRAGDEGMQQSEMRARVADRMAKEGIPVGTDDPMLQALGAPPLPKRMTALRPWRADNGREGTRLYLWCPGCDDLHAVEIKDQAVKWEWDGNEDAPTISPSILVNGRPESHGTRCHSFVRAGRWEFLSDCDHALAGQTVPMVPLPAWTFS